MENKNERITERSEQDKKIMVNRLNRISGQVAGVKKMIVNNKYCNEILIQLSAICKSVKSLANLIIENHLYNCVVKDIKEGNLGVLSEVTNWFKRLQ